MTDNVTMSMVDLLPLYYKDYHTLEIYRLAIAPLALIETVAALHVSGLKNACLRLIRGCYIYYSDPPKYLNLKEALYIYELIISNGLDENASSPV